MLDIERSPMHLRDAVFRGVAREPGTTRRALVRPRRAARLDKCALTMLSFHRGPPPRAHPGATTKPKKADDLCHE